MSPSSKEPEHNHDHHHAENPETAETADGIEATLTPEAAPAALPATEQAENENSPHGEEVHENH